MQAPVEVRYAGVMISRAQEVKAVDGDDSSFFIFTREPMPVGTVVRLRSGDRETPARVVHTVESVGSAKSGMEIHLIGESEEVAPEWIPSPVDPADEVPSLPKSISGETSLGGTSTRSSSFLTPENVANRNDDPGDSPEVSDTSAAEAPAEQVAVDIASAEIAVGQPSSDAQNAAPAEQAAQSPASAEASGGVIVAQMEEKAAIDQAVPTEVEGGASSGSSGGSSGEVRGSDEAIPVAVGASMTDALETAAASASESSAPEPSVPEPSVAGELPPARPLSGPSGRRKTKRRK